MPESPPHRFELLTKLGAGAMGVVYEAHDRVRDMRVAYKTLHRLSGTSLYQLKREFRVASQISHPNIVSLFELGADGSRWYITMELVPGQDFLSHVRNGRAGPSEPAPNDTIIDASIDTVATDNPEAETIDESVADLSEPIAGTTAETIATLDEILDRDRLRDGLWQLVSGLGALHGQGIVHRDLKPSNIRVTPEGRVVLLDFGIVAQLRDRDDGHVGGKLTGTPLFMAPEQARGAHPTAASDWYAFGVLLYQILTGRFPFTGNALWVMQAKQQSDPRAPRTVISAIPQPLDHLCMGLLRRDPSERFDAHDVRRLLQQSFGHARVVRQPTATRAVVGTAPFVGRKAQLEALWHSFETSKRGRPVIVWLHGASGLGKSELMHFFLSELKAHKAAITLAGRCHEQESVPFKALDALIDKLSGYLLGLGKNAVKQLLSPDIGALARLFPVLRRVDTAVSANPQSADIPDRQRLRKRASAALQRLLAQIAEKTPLVLAIDDLQWGDADSGALLYELLSTADAPPMLVIASYRDDHVDPGPLLELLRRDTDLTNPGPRVRDISLKPLSERHATRLAALLFDRAEHEAQEICADIARESGGSPFFVQELVRYTLERSDSGQEPDGATIRPTLERVLDARLALVGADALHLLRVLATAGRPLERDIAVSAAGIAPRDEQAIAVVRTGNMIRIQNSRDGAQLLEMYHDRIRQVVVNGMTDEQFRHQHAELARVMEASDSADHESLALHFRAAGNAQKASFYMAAAARAAERTLAFDHAAQLYRSALAMTPVRAREQAQLTVGLGNALANAGRGGEAARAYLSAVDHPEADPVELRRLAATQFLLSGYFDEGLAVLETVLQAAGLKLASTPRRALASLLWRRAQVRMRGSRFTERADARASSQEHAEVAMFWTLSSTLGMIDTIRGQDYQARHLLAATRVGDTYYMARAVAMEAAYSASAGRTNMRRTAMLVARANQLAHQSGNPHAIALAHLCSAIASFCVGQWHEALGQVEDALTCFRERCTGVAWEIATCLNFKLNSLYYTGDHGTLRATVTTELKGAKERGDRYLAAVLRTSFGELAWLIDDQLDTACEQVEEAIDTWSRRGFQMQHYWALRAQCYIDLYCQRGESAVQRLDDRWTALSRSLLLRVQVIRAQMVHLRAKAALCAALRAAEPAPLLRAASRHASALEREKMPWIQPMARLVHASVSAQRGEIDAAVEQLAAAEEEFTEGGMALYAAIAGWHRGQLLGGDQGEKLADERRAHMTRLGVRAIERIASTLAPGLTPVLAHPERSDFSSSESQPRP